jgi:NADH-ubiquinone oxidoreductase chain 4
LIVKARYYIYQHEKNKDAFIVLVIFISLFLILSFRTTSRILFYISFETTLIPIFLMIIGWGYQPERLKASLFLLFYTLFASLPLLLAILLTYRKTGTSIFYLLSSEPIGPTLLIRILLTIAFLVKIPIYIGHL